MSESQSVRVFGGNGFEDPTQSDLQKLSNLPDAREVQKQNGDGPQSQQSEGTDAGPPYFTPEKDPAQLLELLEKSETHQACVEAKSKGVAGHGFDIVPHDSVDADSVGDTPDALTDFWFSGSFKLGPGKINASANEVLESGWDDFEAIGYLTLEILANPMDGQPTGLAHIPAHKIRKRRNKPGYVELDDAGKITHYYGEAGDRYDDEPTFVNGETGEVTESGGESVANEIICIRNYSALAPHYGLPDIVPGIKTLAGDLSAREYNRVFFQNDTVPRLAVIVEGGELTDKAWTELEKQFKKLRENKNAHRGLLLETKGTVETQFGTEQGANIRIEPLTVDVQEDMGFVTYRKSNEHYILQAHNVPPVVAGRTQDVNRSTAKTQRVNFAQETIAPKQARYAARLYQVLHVQAFEKPDFTIDFVLHGGSNELRESKILKNKASSVKTLGKVMTTDEIRTEVFDLPPSADVDGETMAQENAPDQQPGDEQPTGAGEDEGRDEPESQPE